MKNTRFLDLISAKKTFILLIGSFCVWGSIRKVNTGMRSWRRFCPTKWQESNVLAYRGGQPLIHFPASCWKTDCIRFVFSAKHPPLVAFQPKLAKSVGVLGGHFGQHPATNAVLRSSPNKSVQGGNKPDSGSVRINNFWDENQCWKVDINTSFQESILQLKCMCEADWWPPTEILSWNFICSSWRPFQSSNLNS